MTKTMAMLIDAIVSTDGNIIILCKYSQDFNQFVEMTKEHADIGVFTRDINHARRVIRTDWGSTLRFITTDAALDRHLRGYSADYVFTNDYSMIGNENVHAVCAGAGAPLIFGSLFPRHGNG